MTLIAAEDASTFAPPPGAFRKTKWSVIWLLTLTLFSALTVGGMFAPLQDAAKADLGISDLQLGLLAGMASAVPVALLSLPIAWMVDHKTRSRLLIFLASLWAFGTIGTAFVQDFTQLFAVRLIAGVGGGCAFPVVVSLLADVCMPDRRGRSMLLVSVGAWAGAGAAFAIGGSLFGYFAAHPGAGLMGLAPWRETHLLVGIGAVLLVLPLFLMREPQRYEVGETALTLRASMAGVWRRRKFLLPLFVGQMSGGMAEGAAAIWIGSVLTRAYGLQPGEFGGWVGLVILGAGIVGSIIGGFTADLGHKTRIRGGILLPALIATALTIPASAYPIMPTVGGFAWVLFALLLGGTIVNLVASAAIAVLIPNEERAICLAGLKIMGSVIAVGLAPPLIAWLASYADGPGGMGQVLTWLGVVTGFISLAGFWLAMVHAPQNIAKAAQV
ncbi:hypothetical protein sos41_40030 [Alphaproteobacteria bacterium SO-S41]|nr:hypothetical protein sos41_40030 [Alphaproteobacteria bacterium SO-S41]